MFLFVQNSIVQNGLILRIDVFNIVHYIFLWKLTSPALLWIQNNYFIVQPGKELFLLFVIYKFLMCFISGTRKTNFWLPKHLSIMNINNITIMYHVRFQYILEILIHPIWIITWLRKACTQISPIEFNK